MTTLKEQAQELASSSKFTSGDKLSFKVPLADDVELPGKFDPKEYLDKLDLSSLKGMAVAVVCAENGGIVAECVRRGAKLTLACEPRYFYHQSLPAVLRLIQKPMGRKTGYLASWPRGDEAVDLVLWPDGLQDSRHPRMILKKVFSMLRPGGVVYIEAVIGGHGVPGATTNSWKPTESVLEETLREEAPNAMLEKVGDGRLTNRVIYRICEEAVVIEGLGGPDMDTIEGVEKAQKKIRSKTPAKKPKKAAAKKKKKPAKPRKKRASKKEKQVMELTKYTLDEVRAEVKLWGEGWLDQTISALPH